MSLLLSVSTAGKYGQCAVEAQGRRRRHDAAKERTDMGEVTREGVPTGMVVSDNLNKGDPLVTQE